MGTQKGMHRRMNKSHRGLPPTYGKRPLCEINPYERLSLSFPFSHFFDNLQDFPYIYSIARSDRMFD